MKYHSSKLISPLVVGFLLNRSVSPSVKYLVALHSVPFFVVFSKYSSCKLYFSLDLLFGQNFIGVESEKKKTLRVKKPCIQKGIFQKYAIGLEDLAEIL